jgi:hypothetical protein
LAQLAVQGGCFQVVRAGNKRFLRRKSSEEEPSCGLFPPVSALLQRSWVFTLPIALWQGQWEIPSRTCRSKEMLYYVFLVGGLEHFFPYIGKDHPN